MFKVILFFFRQKELFLFYIGSANNYRSYFRFRSRKYHKRNIETVHYCQEVFGCELPSVLLVARYDKFIKKLACNPLSLVVS